MFDEYMTDIPPVFVYRMFFSAPMHDSETGASEKLHANGQ